MSDEKSTVPVVRFLPTANMRRRQWQAMTVEERRQQLKNLTERHKDNEEGSSSAVENDPIDDEFNMDAYDDDDENQGMNLFSVVDKDLKLLEKEDEYLKGDAYSDSEDEEYYNIKETDVLFLAGNADEDMCSMEVYLHDTIEGGMYVHHDFMLSSYPLCIDYVPRDKDNLVVVGTFDPIIEFWDLSALDALEPVAILGQSVENGKSKKSKKKVVGKNANHHTDAVLSVHVCPQNVCALASGSADETVKVWDLKVMKVVSSLDLHKDKVQSVKWHPIEAGLLLTCGYDKCLYVSDMRSASQSLSLNLGSDPECAMWCRHAPVQCIVADEKGVVACWDVRNASNPVWQMETHSNDACSSITDVLGCSRLLVSCGVDGSACVWDSLNCSIEPQLVCSRELGAGKLFSVSSCDEDPSLFVFGGNTPVLWNITDTDMICKTFPELPGASDPNTPSTA